MTSPIAAIHVVRKQLDLDGDVYRAILVAITGKAWQRIHECVVDRNSLQRARSQDSRPVAPAVSGLVKKNPDPGKVCL